MVVAPEAIVVGAALAAFGVEMGVLNELVN